MRLWTASHSRTPVKGCEGCYFFRVYWMPCVAISCLLLLLLLRSVFADQKRAGSEQSGVSLYFVHLYYRYKYYLIFLALYKYLHLLGISQERCRMAWSMTTYLRAYTRLAFYWGLLWCTSSVFFLFSTPFVDVYRCACTCVSIILLIVS